MLDDGCMWMHVDACGCMWMHVDACGCMWMHRLPGDTTLCRWDWTIPSWCGKNFPLRSIFLGGHVAFRNILEGRCCSCYSHAHKCQFKPVSTNHFPPTINIPQKIWFGNVNPGLISPYCRLFNCWVHLKYLPAKLLNHSSLIQGWHDVRRVHLSRVSHCFTKSAGDFWYNIIYQKRQYLNKQYFWLVNNDLVGTTININKLDHLPTFETSAEHLVWKKKTSQQKNPRWDDEEKPTGRPGVLWIWPRWKGWWLLEIAGDNHGD